MNEMIDTSAATGVSRRSMLKAIGTGVSAAQDHLQSDRSPRVHLLGEVDHAHAAAAEFAHNAVTGECRRRGRIV